MGTLFITTSGPEPTTAASATLALAAALHTNLQVATPSTTKIKLVEWGISFDNTTVNTPVKVELIQTDVAATTITSRTPTLYDDPLGPASLCVGGTSATGFSATGATEGTITAVRTFDLQLVPPTGQYVKQWPLGREAVVPVSKFVRIRTTPAATVNAYMYIIWEE